MDPIQEVTTLERRLALKAQTKRIPINGSIELLPLCNMKCDMCYVRLSKEEMDKQGRLRTWEEWLEIGRQMKESGTLFLLLTGGEPLMFPDFRKLYLGLRDLGMAITINTNATLLDEDWASFFGKYKPRRMNITLYGADENAYRNLCHYPGGFEKTITAVKLLLEQGVDVKLASSLAKSNQEDMDRIIEIGETLGIPVRIDTYMMPAQRERFLPYNEQARLDPKTAAQVRIQILKKEMGTTLFSKYVDKMIFEVEHILPEDGPGKVGCMAGSCSFTINWQGLMRPCVVLNQPSVSVFEHGFAKAWEQTHQTVSRIRTSSVCSSCNLRPVCRTCFASALLEEGRYDAVPRYMCEYAKESLRLIYLEKEKMNTKEENGTKK